MQIRHLSLRSKLLVMVAALFTTWVVLALAVLVPAAGAEREGALRGVLIFCGVGFLLAAAFSLLGGTLIARPLRRLSQLAEQVAEGNLASAQELLGGEERVRRLGAEARGQRGGDEIRQLEGSFARMLVSLHDASATLVESAQLLMTSVDNLSTTAFEQGQTITAQASAIQQTQVTVQELQQTSILATQRAQHVLQGTAQADAIFRSGEATIQKSLGGFGEMHTRVAGIADDIKSLAERTRAIGEITDTVKDLADQSNMLALNAAIEAVRSGEHGKGFGVVAREIRSLADQSISATSRARSIVQDVVLAAGSTASLTEAGARTIEGSLEHVRMAGDSLRQLSELVTTHFDAVRQIAATVSLQTAGVSELHTAVRELATLMEDTERRLKSVTDAVTIVKAVTDKVGTVAQRFRV